MRLALYTAASSIDQMINLHITISFYIFSKRFDDVQIQKIKFVSCMKGEGDGGLEVVV